MTEYNLPEGMTAEGLRRIADIADPGDWVVDLNAWADAIDPPKPPSVITDDMVEAVQDEAKLSLPTTTRFILEAVEALGWLRDPDESFAADNPCLDSEEGCGYFGKNQELRQENYDLAERLEMAEGLLRTLDPWDVGSRASDGSASWSPPSALRVDADEAEYLRSLNGEGA